MRLININKAKTGDILGQSIFGNDGCLILSQGIALTDAYINRLINMGISCLYIDDDRLDDIKPQDPELVAIKGEAIKSLSKVFSKLEYDDGEKIKEARMSVAEIVEYLLDNKETNCSYIMDIKTFDNYTYVHSLNTCMLTLFFGIQMSYSRNMLIDLGTGSLLHDVGKTKIPINILNKRGKLTSDEYEIVRKHPIYGYEMLKKADEVNDISKLVVLQHHEKVDGTSYPYGIKSDKIVKYAKIACISDVYDAIISDRVYRKGFAANEAYEFIMAGSGTFFDIKLVQIFKNSFSIYPLGVCVKLSDGVEGFVVKHNKGFPDRPVVRVFYDEYGNVIAPYEINLMEKLNITIDSIIM